MVFIGLISTSLQPLSPTSWLPSTPQPFPCRVRAKRVVVAVPKKSLVTIILVRSPSHFIFTQFGCLLTAPKRKKVEIPNFIFFGLSPLTFLCMKALGKIWKMTPLLCACAVVITLETQKCRKRAPRSVEFNFFINFDRQKRFLQNERKRTKRTNLQNLASVFLIFA